MKYRIAHLTEYRYVEPVTLSHHVAHLIPRGDGGQLCGPREIRIDPVPAVRRERLDAFGNRALYFSIEEPHRRLIVHASCEVTVPAPPRPPIERGPAWEAVRERLRQERRADLLEALAFTHDSPYARRAPALARFAAPSFPPGRPLLEGALALTRHIHREFSYDPRATNVSTPLADVLAQRRGVCQDFAHLQIACLRSLGLPARYVSGYLLTRPPAGRPRLQGADASHAWVSVYLPDFGWVDFDPTNDLIPGEEHVTVACGRDFGDVTPVRGVILGGGAHELRVSVDVVGVP